MVALKAYFHFINNRFLNPKKAFWNAAKSWAADFCILIYSEYEKKKKGIIQGTHFKNARKQILLIPLFSSIIVCEVVRKSWQVEL